jgi:flagellum-specific peptidoglycan hydrolase FlgJ
LEDAAGVAALELEYAEWVLAQRDAVGPPEALASELLRNVRTEDGRALAIEGLVALTTDDWPEDYRGAFLRSLAPGALHTAVTQGVPASVTLAQAVQESGWGRSSLARRHHNLFGVKAGTVKEGRQAGVVLQTREVREGRSEMVQQRFATFGDWSQSVAHHGALLGGDRRYAKAQAHQDDWRRYVAALAPVYATDPAYAERVGAIIERYALDRWDALVVDVVAKAQTNGERRDHS